MKHLLSSILFIVLMAGCTGGGKYATNKDGARIVRMATNIKSTSFLADTLNEFYKLINERTGNAYEFQIFYDGQLGEQKEIMELIRANGIEIGWANTAVLENYVDFYGAFNLPYLLNSDEQVTEAYSSKVLNDFLTEKSVVQNFMPLLLLDNTPRSFFGSKPYLKPADLVGEKIRIQQSPVYVKIVEALGASPIPIPYVEQFTSLQQGVIDGAESGPTILQTDRLGEVAKHFTYTETTRPIDVAVMSINFWNSLSEEHKQIFIKTRDEVIKNFHLQNYYKIANPLIEQAKTELDAIYYTNADLSAFRTVLAPIKEEWGNKSPEHAEFLKLVESFE